MKREKLIEIIEKKFMLTEKTDGVDTYVSINDYEVVRIIERHSELEVAVNLGCFKISKIKVGKYDLVYFISSDNKILNLSEIKDLDTVEFIEGIDECIANIEMPTEDCDLGLIDEEDLSEEYTPKNEEYTPDKPTSEFNKNNGCIKESFSNDNINYIKR